MTERPPQTYGVRSAAQARSAMMHTRVKLLRAVVALVRSSYVGLKYQAARAERAGRDAESQSRIDAITTKLANVQTAVDYARQQGSDVAENQHTIEAGNREMEGLSTQLGSVLAEREWDLNALAEKVDQLEADRKLVASELAIATEALGARAVSVDELLGRIDLPGFDELLRITNTHARLTRAESLLHAVTEEASRADAELGRVGLSEDYDRLLMDVIDAERLALLAGREEARVSRARDLAVNKLFAAERALRLIQQQEDMAPASLGVNGGANGNASSGSEPDAGKVAAVLGNTGPLADHPGPAAPVRTSDSEVAA